MSGKAGLAPLPVEPFVSCPAEPGRSVFAHDYGYRGPAGMLLQLPEFIIFLGGPHTRVVWFA